MVGPSDDPNASSTMPVAPTTRALPDIRTSVPSAGSPGLAYGSSLRAVAQALDPDLASVVAAVPAWSGLEPEVAPLGHDRGKVGVEGLCHGAKATPIG